MAQKCWTLLKPLLQSQCGEGVANVLSVLCGVNPWAEQISALCLSVSVHVAECKPACMCKCVYPMCMCLALGGVANSQCGP